MPIYLCIDQKFLCMKRPLVQTHLKKRCSVFPRMGQAAHGQNLGPLTQLPPAAFDGFLWAFRQSQAKPTGPSSSSSSSTKRSSVISFFLEKARPTEPAEEGSSTATPKKAAQQQPKKENTATLEVHRGKKQMLVLGDFKRKPGTEYNDTKTNQTNRNNEKIVSRLSPSGLVCYWKGAQLAPKKHTRWARPFFWTPTAKAFAFLSLRSGPPGSTNGCEAA